ncbi:MAG: hypothetical protein WCL30_05440, partial [Pseudomonadota bacterium]
MNLKITARFSLSIMFFVIPLGLLLYFYTGEITKQIDFATQEKAGNAYLRPLVRLLSDVNIYQIKAWKLNSGDKNAEKELNELSDKIDDEVAALDAVQAKYGEILKFTPEGLKSRKREQFTIQALKEKLNSIQKSNKVSDDAALYQSAIDDLKVMIAHAGDMSNLILDPDLDSYYTMDATVVGLVQGIGRYAQVTATVLPLLHTGNFSDKQKAALATFAAMIAESDVGRVAGDIDTAFNEDPNFYGVSPTFKSSLQPKLDAYKDSADVYKSAILGFNDKVSAEKIAEFLKQSEDVSLATIALWDSATDELDILLDKRIASFSKDRMMTLL